VLAHEWGHAVQSPIRHGFEGASVTAELQADCFAGAWFGRIASGGATGLSLDTSDLDGAIAALLLLRDTPGARYGDPRADGSAFDRIHAFEDGLDEGLARCTEYEADGVSLVDVPTATGEAADRTLAEAVESVTDHLPVFFDEHVGLRQQLYDPSRGQPNPCPEPAIGPVSFCERTGTVVGDAAQLRHLHGRIGDFSAALLFAAEWGRAVAIDRGVAEATSIDLIGECLAGAWAGEVSAADADETGVVLAPGDLDEALATLLRFGRASHAGSATLRADLVQQGFLAGAEACFEPE
jgi:predicted metalloprotease